MKLKKVEQQLTENKLCLNQGDWMKIQQLDDEAAYSLKSQQKSQQ